MNKFKLPNSCQQAHQRKTEPEKQQRREQVQLLSILDKCTQILRDDRIWLRNRIKEMDPDIQAIFRKSLKRVTANRISEAELHTLQVSLRKYVNRIKDKHKQEQLNRFKENLCSGTCLCEHRHAARQQEGSRGNLTAGGSDLWGRREEDVEESASQDYHQQQLPFSDNTFSNVYKHKKKNIFETLKLNEPIEEESETEKQLQSYRSRSEEPFSRMPYYAEESHLGKQQKTNQRKSSQLQRRNNQKEYLNQDYTPPKSSNSEENRYKNWSMYNKGTTDNQAQLQGKNLTYQYLNISENKSQRVEKGLTTQSEKKQEQTVDNIGDDVAKGTAELTGTIVNIMVKQQKKYSEQKKYSQQNKQISSSYLYSQQQTSAQKYEASSSFQQTLELQTQQHSSYFSSTNLVNSQKPITFSSQSLLDVPKIALPAPLTQNSTPAFSQYKPFDFSSCKTAFNNDFSSKSTFSLPKQTSDDQNLFTSPELLMECRKILEKSAEKKNSAFQKTSQPIEGYVHIATPVQTTRNSSASGSFSLTSLTAANGGLPTTSAIPGLPSVGPASIIGSSSSYGLGYVSHTSASSYSATATTTLVNNFTFKQVTSTDTLPPYYNDTKSIVDKSPYQFPAVISDTQKDINKNTNVSNFSKQSQKKSDVFQSFPVKQCLTEIKSEQFKLTAQKPPIEKANPLANLVVAESFQKQSEQQQQSHALVCLDKLSAEQVFDIFFFNNATDIVPPNFITSEEFFKIASQHFQELDNFEKIFESCHISGIVNALDFGSTLDKVLGKEKQGQIDAIRQIFGLIDIKQKGFFSLDDYQRFLEQVLECQQDNYEQVTGIASRLFELADIKNNKNIEYWGLYLTKQTDQFQSFSEYLSQFEFEVEI